jgi:hypothetical protein
MPAQYAPAAPAAGRISFRDLTKTVQKIAILASNDPDVTPPCNDRPERANPALAC